MKTIEKQLIEFKKQILKGRQSDFTLFFNSRNIRRKQIPDTMLAFRAFLDTLPKEKADKCKMVLHTEAVTDHGTDLYKVKEYFFDETYPNADIIGQDLEVMTYYVAEIRGIIIGGINIDQNQDKTYLDIDWEDTSNSFLVVHRLAVKEEFWKKKIGKKLMIFAENMVIEKGLKSIRLDTYSGNPKAMEFYRRLGYRELGYINLKPNKNEYYCFEKIIK